MVRCARWLRGLAGIGLLAGLAGAAPAAAADALSPHQRELLLAQLEDLQARLAAESSPAALAEQAVAVELRAGAETRGWAGAVLERSPVRLRGQAELVLRRLANAARRGLIARPPWRLRSLAGTGRPIALDISLWRLRPEPFDDAAADRALIDLRDNLLWHERGRGQVDGRLALLDALARFETVRLDEARRRGPRLTLQARALDAAARRAYVELVAERVAALARPPELEAAVAAPPPLPAPQPDAPAGLALFDCPLADAVLLAGSLARAELLLLAEPGRRLSGRQPGADAAARLAAVIAASGLDQARFGAVRLLGHGLGERPPPLVEQPGRAVELVLKQQPPAAAWRLLDGALEPGLLVAGDPRRRLSAVLRRRAAGQVARLLAWVQGLRGHGDDALLLLLPADRDPPAPDPRAVLERVGLRTRAAPLAELVAGLIGRERVQRCGPAAAPVELRVAGVAGGRLLAGLLAAAGRELALDDAGARLHPPAAADCDAPQPSAEPAAPRLAAVLTSAQGNRALVGGPGGWRWLAAGDALDAGRRVLAVTAGELLAGQGLHATRLALAGPSRRRRPERAAAQPGPTRQGLSDLRLAATALVPGSPALALVEDRRGHVHRLAVGNAVGRRCGRVTAVLDGAVEITLGCPRGPEPPEVVLRAAAPEAP